MSKIGPQVFEIIDGQTDRQTHTQTDGGENNNLASYRCGEVNDSEIWVGKA
jgi:hypothetical protein